MTYIIDKGWGREVIFADQDDYCGKILQFARAGNKFSMHFHVNKDETWYVKSGSFLLSVINTNDAKVSHRILQTGDTWRNPPLLPHQIEALDDDSELIEVSTCDDPADSYRVAPGDSQKTGLDNLS